MKRRERNGNEPPPQELEEYELWCINRGLFDPVAHCYTGDRAEWKRARRAWFREHGWPGGMDALLAGEVVVEDGPFGDDLPHAGPWARPRGGHLVCELHALPPEMH